MASDPAGPVGPSSERAVTLTVLTEDGSPVPGAQAVFTLRNPAPEEGAADRAGARTITGVSDERGRLELAVPVECGPGSLVVTEEEHVDHVVGEWGPQDEVIRLKRARSLEGTVRDLFCVPVGEGFVSWTNDEGVEEAAPVGSLGEFAFARLPRDPITLTWKLRERSSTDPRHRFFVAADAEAVDWIVDPGPRIRIRITDWPTKCVRRASLTPEDAEAPYSPELAEWVSADGTVDFYGLRDGVRYVLWVDRDLPESFGMRRRRSFEGMVYRAGVVASPELLVVPWHPGRTYWGTLEIPERREGPAEDPDSFAIVRVVGRGWERFGRARPEEPEAGREHWWVLVDALPDVPAVVQVRLFRRDVDRRQAWEGLAEIPAPGDPLRIRMELVSDDPLPPESLPEPVIEVPPESLPEHVIAEAAAAVIEPSDR